jgi:hypothetical protein
MILRTRTVINKACLDIDSDAIRSARPARITHGCTYLLRVIGSCADVVVVTFRSANYQYEMSKHDGIRRLTILSSAATNKGLHNRVSAVPNTTDVPCKRQAYSES